MKPEKKDTREAIITATLELVAEYGFHGTPTSMIATEAGVGVGSIYRYFKDKDELIHAVQSEVEARLMPEILRGYSGDMPIRTRFIHLCTNLLQYLVQNPKEFKFLEQYYNSPYGADKRRQKMVSEHFTEEEDPFRNLFETGMAHEVVKDLPMPTLCALTFGPIISLVNDQIAGFVEVDETMIRALAEACWDAVKR